MCVFSGPTPPPPAALPAAPDPSPQASDPQVTDARNTDRARRLKAAAGNDTLVTGGAGLTTPAATGLKTAFGQ